MYLDALSDLVAAHEDEHYAIEPASDADMLRHLMEAKGVTQALLSRDTTIPKSTISEILAGKKPSAARSFANLQTISKWTRAFSQPTFERPDRGTRRGKGRRDRGTG